MIFSLFKHRTNAAAVTTSATELIATYGDQAYYAARDREKGRIIDGLHTASHWRRVALEIARRL